MFGIPALTVKIKNLVTRKKDAVVSTVTALAPTVIAKVVCQHVYLENGQAWQLVDGYKRRFTLVNKFTCANCKHDRLDKIGAN